MPRCSPATRWSDPHGQVISSEELRSLVECLGDTLSDLESGVLTMYLEGRSYEEIAERLDCTPKTVNNALQRVKRKVLVHLRGRERCSTCAERPPTPGYSMIP